jgi:hypothetical protein
VIETLDAVVNGVGGVKLKISLEIIGAEVSKGTHSFSYHFDCSSAIFAVY